MEISREVKKELRGRIRECRKRVSREEKENWDALLCEQFITLLEEASFPVSLVYLYQDFRGEAGTRRILEALWAKNIPAALPRVEGEEIFFYEVRGWADVCPGYMGIEEPSAGCRPVMISLPWCLSPGWLLTGRAGGWDMGAVIMTVFLPVNRGIRAGALPMRFRWWKSFPKRNGIRRLNG